MRKWTGKRRFSGVVRIEKVCWRVNRRREGPERVHRAIEAGEDHAKLEPEKAITTRIRTKVVAFRVAPSQSIWRILETAGFVGCGL